MQDQKLGLQGASTLADVLKVNTTLKEIHCENNGIALSGFTDLVNALHRNTTLTFLPTMQESRQMALKQTEDQVKQYQHDNSTPAQTRSASVRSKISNKVTGKTAKEKAPSMLLSDQDIKAALGLVDESWGRQIYRLQQYLMRNHNIEHGIPTAMDVDEEEYERPDTATSLSRIVERVTFDTTPTAEKDAQLGGASDDERDDMIEPLEKSFERAFSRTGSSGYNLGGV